MLPSPAAQTISYLVVSQILNLLTHSPLPRLPSFLFARDRHVPHLTDIATLVRDAAAIDAVADDVAGIVVDFPGRFDCGVRVAEECL